MAVFYCLNISLGITPLRYFKLGSKVFLTTKNKLRDTMCKLSEANKLFPGDIIYSGTPEMLAPSLKAMSFFLN